LDSGRVTHAVARPDMEGMDLEDANDGTTRLHNDCYYCDTGCGGGSVLEVVEETMKKARIG